MPKKRKYQQGGRIIQGDLVTPGGPGSKSTIDTTKPLKQLNLSNITGPTADMGPSGGFKWGRTSGHVLYNVDRDPYTKYISQPFSFITDDPDDLRAQNQSFGEKAAYMLPKLVTRVGTNVAGSSIGLLYGGGAFLHGLLDGNPETNPNKAFWDNSFQRSLDGINDWMDNKLPHYYTKDEQEYGFFKAAFGKGAANFWMNDFTQGLSFIVGAVLTESLVRGMGQSTYWNKAKSLFHKKGRVPYKETKSTIGEIKNASQLLATKDKLRGGLLTLRQLGTGAMYEAGVESRHHYDRTLERLVDMHKQRHMGQEPNTQQMAELVQIATQSSNAVWAGNVALVGFGNYLLFPKIFGRGYNSSKNIFGQVGEELSDVGTKYINLMTAISRKEAILRNTWSVLRTPLYEGFVEEGGQKLLDVAGHDAAINFYLSKKDPTYLGMIDELISNTDSAFAEAYGSAEGQKEIGIGFLLAAMGLPGRKSVTGKDGKTTRKWGMIGGSYNSYTNMKETEVMVDDLVKILNEGGSTIDNLKAGVDMLSRAGKFTTMEDVAMLINSPLMKKNGEYHNLFLHAMTKIRVGLEQSLRDDIDKTIRQMSLEDFRETFSYEATNDYNDQELEAHKDKVIESLHEQIDQIKENWGMVNGTFGTFGEDQKIMMTHALSISEHFDQREESMIEANNKVGLQENIEVEEKTEIDKVQQDKAEQESLLNRLRNIWQRFTSKQKEDISKMPEAKEVKKKRNIREFTSPSHLEELYLELAVKIKSLQEQIEAVKNDPNINDMDQTKKVKNSKGVMENVTTPSDKKQQLEKLNEELDALLDRKIYLTKALNEGLDPDLSKDEQRLLDEWQKRDPVAYAAHHKDVIKRLKDIRNIRAYRHRMIDMYNQMVQVNSSAARENVTWTDKGTLIPRPEILLMRQVADLENLSDKLSDRELARLYERYNGKTITFTYQHKGDITVKEVRKFARQNNALEKIDKRALEILQAEKHTEVEAYLQALAENNIPYDVNNRTEEYTVFVKQEQIENENARVLIRLPDYDTIKKLKRKAVLEDLMRTNKEAKKEYDLLLEELELHKTEYTAYTLNMLKGATDIKVVDSNEVVIQAIESIVELTEDEIKISIETTKQSLEKAKKELNEIVKILSAFQNVKQSPESFRKKDKHGREYFTVNGVNYSLKGITNKIAFYTLSQRIPLKDGSFQIVPSQIEQLEAVIEQLEIKLNSYKADLDSFYKLEPELNKSKSIEKIQETIFTFMKEKWVGDQMLIEQLRKSEAFTNNPVMRSIWENILEFDPSKDEASRVVNNLIKVAQQDKELPNEIIRIIDQEIESIKKEYSLLKSAAAAVKKHLNIKQNGEVSLRSKKETLAEYNRLLDEMAKLDILLGKLTSENVTAELRMAIGMAKAEFQQRNRDFEIAHQLQTTLVQNLGFVVNTYNELRYGKTQEINNKEEPNTKEGEMAGQESIEEIFKDPESNVYYYGTPITKHGFAKSASDHKLALEKEKSLRLMKEESPESQWTPKLEKELQFYSAINRFHKFTETLSVANQDNYRLTFVNRQTIPEELSDKVLFYNEKTNSFSYAKDIKTELGSENTEDIKIIITDKKGNAVTVKDNDGVDQIMYASVPSANVTVQFKKKGETITAYRYSKEDLVSTTVKEVSHKGRIYFTGELTEDAVDAIEKHITFRDGLLKVSGPRHVKISGTSNGMPIWVNGDPSHRAKASETIVQNENQVKDVKLNIGLNSKNNIVNFENRRYKIKAGTPYVVKNGRLVPLFVDTLSMPHQKNIYNLLRLYATQLLNVMNANTKVNSKDAAYIHTLNENGEAVYAPETANKTIEQILKTLIYFGKHSKNRASKEYSIYLEGKTLFFGSNQIDINELANPTDVNKDIHNSLQTFLATLNYQINNATLKDDINARAESQKKLGSELAKWKKRLGAAMKKKGFNMNQIKSLPKKKQTEFYKALQTWKRKNPKPTASDISYTSYTEVIVNDDLTFDFRTWTNYTEYLLSGAQGRNLMDIPFKLNLHRDRSGQGVDTSMTPQFMSVYVVWNKNITVNELLTNDDLVTTTIQDSMIKKKNEVEIADTETDMDAVNEEDPIEVVTDSGYKVGEVKTITHQSVGENPAWKANFEITGINFDTATISVNVKNAVLINKDNSETELDPASINIVKDFIEKNLFLEEEINSKYSVTDYFEVIDETTASTTDLDTLQKGQDGGLERTIDPEDSAASGEKGGQAFNVSMPHEEFELMDLSEEYEQFKAMVPKNQNGTPIFKLEIVQGLVHGQNYGYFTKLGKILLSSDAIKGTLYHETFHAITRKLLSPAERAELYQEVRNMTGKASTYKGDVKKLKDFTDKEADEWLAEEFRQYVVLKGDYKVGSRVKKSLIQKIFDFIYKFFNNLSRNQRLFENIYSGKYSETIDNYTTYTIKEGAALNATKIDAAASKDINEAMTAAIFDIAMSSGLEFSQFFNFSKENKTLELFLAPIYGRPGLKGKTAYNKVRGDLEEIYFNLESKINNLESKSNLSEKEKVLLNTYKLEKATIYNTAEAVRLDWNSFVEKNTAFLRRYKFDVNFKTLQEEISTLNEDPETGEVVAKDTASYRSVNEIDPASTISPELKLIIATLPAVEWTIGEEGKVFKYVTSKYGLNKLANFGQVLNTLYKNLSNLDSTSAMLSILDDLAETDATYQVLLNRLGLSKSKGFSSYAAILDQSLTKEEMKLLMSFLTSFKTTSKEYKILNVDTEQRRTLINADQDNINSVVKAKWKAKFRQRLNTEFGINNADKRLVMDLTKKLSLKMEGRTVSRSLGTEKGWFLSNDRETEQNIAILKHLGIEFTNLPELLDLLSTNAILEDEFNTNIDWIFADIAMDIDEKTKKPIYLTTKDMSDLFDNTDSFGRLQKLIEYEASTTKQVISLQNRFNNKKRHGVTIKNFTSSFIDYLNSDPIVAQTLLEKFNMQGSVWLQRIAAGIEIKLVSLLGNSNKETNKDVEISRANEGSILLNHVNSILKGYFPIIRTGNKKSEDAIYIGPPSYNITETYMLNYLMEILKSEIKTANAIFKGEADHIPSLKDKKGLQWFDHPAFTNTKALANKYIQTSKNLDKSFINELEQVASKEIKQFLKDKKQETFDLLVEYNILYNDNGTIKNIGLDFDSLELLKETLPARQKANTFIKRDGIVEFELLKGLSGTTKFSPFLDHILTQLTHMQLISTIEQTKIFLAHPGLYKELFKRTSMFSSPKRFLESDENILNYWSENLPNLASKNPNWSPVVTSMVRAEIVESSKYIEQYTRILNYLGASNSSINNMQKSFTNMNIFDGGGLIHIDFYRRARILADHWTDVEEEAYRKVINGTATSKDVGILSPIKPQVVAPFETDNLQLVMGDKFALFPVHPNLHKIIDSPLIVMDQIYVEMTEQEIDYIVFPSSRKIGATTNNKGVFNPLLDENRQHVPLNGDRSAIVTYDLRWFGIQLKPKDSLEGLQSRPTQKTTFIPTDIYNNGNLSPKYADTPLNENSSWEDGINLYHELHEALIQKEVAQLTAKLGAIETAEGFKSLNNKRTRKLIKDTLIEELTKRDIDENIIESIESLFETNITYINQLYQKNRLETLLYSIMTNSVVKRKIYGKKVMIQSVVGYDTAISEGVLPIGTTLKFYGKKIVRKEGESLEDFYRREAFSKTTAAEIYAPYSWKGLLEGQNISELPAEVLTIVGARIPTEFLSSIDVFKIKGFLPKQAGNKMVVPPEIVGKTGADFDSDEITIQLPHIEIKENGGIGLITPVNTLEELRASSPQDYIAAAIELYKMQNNPEGTIEFIKEFNSAIRNNDIATLEGLDNRLKGLGFEDLPPFMQQPKQVVENLLLKLEIDILLHPLSFEQLMDPVGAFDMQDQAEQIQDERIMNGLASPKTTNLFDMLSLRGLVESSNQMWSTLLGTGVVATGATNLIKSQRGGMYLQTGQSYVNILGQEIPFKLYFDGLMDVKKVPFGNVLDLNNNKISSSLRKYITAYVDGEKNPFAMYINAGIEGAGMHVFLNKALVPLPVVIDFMSQPIILDYINMKHRFQGDHSIQSRGSFSKAYKSDIEIVNSLIIKYGRGSGEYIGLRPESLREMRSLSVNDMSPTQKQLQIQILDNFLMYKAPAESLRKIQTVTSPDTSKLKNGYEMIYIQALERIIQEDNYFKNIVGLTGPTKNTKATLELPTVVLDQRPFLNKLKKLFDNSNNLLENLDFKFLKDKNGVRIIEKTLIDLAHTLMSEGKSKQEIINYLQKFDDFITSFMFQTSVLNQYYPIELYRKYGTASLNTLIEQLFQGENSLPRRIIEAKKKYRNNTLLEELIPELQEFTNNKDFDYYIDRIQLASNRYDTDDLSGFGRDAKVLFEKEPELVLDLYLYSFLKSGTSFSPKAFFQALPGSLLLPITQQVFESAKTKLIYNQLNFTEIYSDFLDNQWDNSQITPVKYTSKWDGKKQWIRNKFHGNRILVKSKRGSSQAGIFTRDLYYNYFYRFSKVQTIEKNNKTMEVFVYELHQPKGVRNELIVAGRQPVLNSNKAPKEASNLKLSKKEIEALFENNATQIKRTYKLIEGIYRIKDGKIVDLKKIKSTKTSNIYEISVQRDAVREAPIKQIPNKEMEIQAVDLTTVKESYKQEQKKCKKRK